MNPLGRSRVVYPLVLALVSSAYACGGGEAKPVASVPPPAATPSATVVAPPATPKAPLAGKMLGLDADDEAALDRATSPCDDFYQFACGGWLAKTSIPDDESTWMRSFSTIRLKNELLLKEVLENAAAVAKDPKKAGKDKADADTLRLGKFYASCMDEATLDKLDGKPLAGDLAAVAKAKTPNDVAKIVGTFHARGFAPFFGIGSMQDLGDATKVVAGVDQSGLGLPDRDYYLKTDGKFPHLRDAYTAYLTSLFKLAGEKDAAGLAAQVLAFETKLATAQMTKEDRREPKKLNHPMTADALAKQVPDFAWKTYFSALGSSPANLNVAQPDYVATVAKLVAKEEKPEILRAYLASVLLRGSAGALGKSWTDAQFAFAKELRGQKSQPPRWKRCVRATDGAIGEALGKAFVQKTLGDQGKTTTRDMVVAIEKAMGERLNSLVWMDDATKTNARQKLAKVANKVAAPDKYRDYSALSFKPGSYYANAIASDAFEVKRQLAKVGKPVDRGEWYMTPPSVNAYYDPSMNEMVFPAGILQPPFFSASAPRAKNLGSIGMVMGHELTHGFDDEGRQFDGDGNLRDFWTPKAGEEFVQRATCVEKQFSDFQVNGDHVNGKLTLGENIADLGGIALAYAALTMENPKAAVATGDQVTDAQRFFLGFAQGWCGKYTDEAMKTLVTTNPHSPPKFRVDGPLVNTPVFAQAFGCTAGQPMARTEKNRCQIW
jgi:predicted metalloendopeptidase